MSDQGKGTSFNRICKVIDHGLEFACCSTMVMESIREYKKGIVCHCCYLNEHIPLSTARTTAAIAIATIDKGTRSLVITDQHIVADSNGSTKAVALLK
jgi:hypothetical protein